MSRESVERAFRDRYGKPPDLVVRAPGRVNLIGEHTDYNGGFVLPCAIDFHTWTAASPRTDAEVNVLAVDVAGETDRFSLDAPIAPHPGKPWASYVRGTAAATLGHAPSLPGADLAISGDVPQGAGLSSSASLCVATARALFELAGLETSAPSLARIAQKAENEFAGCRCGIMDPLISAAGRAGHAILIDCRDEYLEAVRLPEEMAILVIDSKVPRRLTDSAYNERRAQCEAAARHFGTTSLRDVSLAGLDANRAALDPVVARRARHVLEENARTRAAANALCEADLPLLGRLMAESHASMRSLFEITVPEIDALVAIVGDAIGDQGGARMTGGGFGGCVVALTTPNRVETVRSAVRERYPRETGLEAEVHVVRASDGVRVLQ